jgi:hypothetical protein
LLLPCHLDCGFAKTVERSDAHCQMPFWKISYAELQ